MTSHPHRRRIPSDAGFNVLELLLVTAIMITVAGIAVALSPHAVAMARGSSGSSRLVSILRTAREQSISLRRDVRVEFIAPNRVRVSREDLPGPVFTVLTDTVLESNVQFLHFGAQGDTPDAFGAAAAVNFGTATQLEFTSDGMFVDQGDNVLNGTVFVAIPNNQMSARAVTIFGPTALIREWKWNGSAARWIE